MTGSLQVKNDKFYAVLNFKNQQGKRAQKWISLNLSVKGNNRRAEILLNELLIQYQGIETIEPMNTLLTKHVAAWIEMDQPYIARTTYDQYINILNNHIAPYFDTRGIILSKLTPGDLEDYYTFKVNGRLSPNTVIKHHTVIRSSLQWTVKHQYIKENAADFADKPTRVHYHGAAPYTIQEVARLIHVTQSEPIGVPIFLASF